jgi:hypothetical protein
VRNSPPSAEGLAAVFALRKGRANCLELFEELQTSHIAHRDRLAKELAEKSA